MTLFDWEQRKFRDIYKKSSEKNDLSYSKDQVISVATMKWSHAPSNSSDTYMKSYNVMKKGDIAFEGHVNKNYIYGRFVENTIGDGIVSHIFDVYTPLEKKHNLNFWKDYISSSKIMNRILRMSTTNARMMSNLVKADIDKQIIYIPSHLEQQQIGDILKTLTKCIDLQQRKLNTLFQYKSQFVNDIFEKQNSNWKTKRLNEFLHVPAPEISNVTTKEQIMTVKLNVGGVVSGASRDTLKLSATKYYVRHAGQLIFGKQNFFNGSIAIVPQNMDGKVTSQDVPSLNIDKDKIDSYFLLYYLSRKNFYEHTERFATGTGSKRLHVETVLNLKIKVPSINMQKKISSVISKINADIQAELKKLNMYKKIKQSLLQNMFI